MKSIRLVVQSMFAFVFKQLARIMIARFRPTIVGVTGNVGKTMSKDMIIAALATQRKVGGTIRSQNSDLTTPLSILGLEVSSKERRVTVWFYLLIKAISKTLFTKTFPEILVLEIGAGGPGDITRQASWLKPDIAVFTALQSAPVHLDYFADRQQLFDEKKQLAVHTKPIGTIIYNSDDEFLPALLSDFSHHSITVGGQGTVVVNSPRNTLGGLETVVAVRGIEYSVQLPGVWGMSCTRSLGLAMAVALELGLDMSDCADNLHEHYRPNPGRMRVLPGINNTVLVDDSYNASPIAVHAALETLDSVEVPGRKIFLFGDMKELANQTGPEHLKVGEHAGQVADLLLTVGSDSKIAHQSAREVGMEKSRIKHFLNSDVAGKYLRDRLEQGDIVLAKSSRHAIQMEKALRYIVEEEHIKDLVQEYL